MADIFISYAREDRQWAKELAETLTKCGWSVWWDSLIYAGASFNRLIENELNEARCVVVLWSRHSIESNYVRNEATAADERGVLVPVLIDDARAPLPFRHLHTTQIKDLDHVIKSISALVAQGSAPTVHAAVPASLRRTTWISSLVIAALIVAIVLIAKKSMEPSDPTNVTTNPATRAPLPKPSVTTSDMTAAADPIKASLTNANPTNANPTNANPTNATPIDARTTAINKTRRKPRLEIGADLVLELTLRRDEPGVMNRYVAEGRGFAMGDLIEVRNQDVVIDIRCIDFDCTDVGVRTADGAYYVSDSMSTAHWRVTIPSDDINRGGIRLSVLVGKFETFRMALINRPQ